MMAIALMAPALLTAQSATETTAISSKMTTGLSLTLIIVLGLLIYTLIEKSKLHKLNRALEQRIQELEK